MWSSWFGEPGLSKCVDQFVVCGIRSIRTVSATNSPTTFPSPTPQNTTRDIRHEKPGITPKGLPAVRANYARQLLTKAVPFIFLLNVDQHE